MHRLPPETSVIAFRQRQLPLRGVVDDEFILKCVTAISDGSEFLLVELPGNASGEDWSHEAGESHLELRDALGQRRNQTVAVGEYPTWLEDGADVVSAVVPDQSGHAKLGVY